MKKTAIIFLVLSFLGLIDAAYLTITHYEDASVVCLLINSCDQVLQSSYATIGSVPVSLLGVVYYLGILILSLISFMKKDEKLD